jgi:predicted outer membrane repeat protein
LALVTVTTDQDVVDFNDGVTSLREAIFATNTVPGADTINFDFGHDGPATILLTQGELRITDDLTIEGYGAALVTIDASGNDPTPNVDDGLGSRIFNIVGNSNGPIDVTIRGLTLTGGDTDQGGAIRNFENLSIFETVVDGNSAIDGGGIYHFTLNAPGGPQSGLLSVVDSTISNNLARVGVGRDPFGGYGGGIFAGGEVVITSSVIHDNTARRGGGIESTVSLNITNSTISGNMAGSGGGIYTGLPSIGSGLTRIAHSTITGNTGDGGGGSFHGQTTVIEHSIIAGNTDGPFGAPGGADLRVTSPTLIVSNSLIGDYAGTPLGVAPVGLPDANGNLIGGPVHGVIDPLLGPLADNGGPTMTHALLSGSPAINLGDLNAVAGDNGVPLYDQRGEPFGRIVGGRIDIGAFEYQQPSDLNLLVDTLVDESDGDYSRGDLSLREAIELTNATNYAGVIDTIHFDPILTAHGPATILLTQGELRISDDLTIHGPGANLLTIDASGNDPTPDVDDGLGSRVFNVVGSSTELIDVTIRGLTLTGGDTNQGGAIRNIGNLTVLEAVIDGNTAIHGGGIYHFTPILTSGPQPGRLSVVDSTISNNLARGDEFSSRGGGIFVSGNSTSGEVEIIRSVINHNTAHWGGGIASDASLTTITESTITENVADLGSGGGILTGLFASNSYGTTRIDQSTISGNAAAGAGGGIFSGHDDVEISDCTISNNSAGQAGGGAMLRGLGGQSNTRGITISASTISGNSAGYGGGGIYSGYGGITISACSISGNSAGGNGGGALLLDSSGYPFNRGLTITASTISGNTAAGGGGGIFARNRRGITITAGAFSGNSAAYSGGGIYATGDSGDVTVSGSTISDNSAGNSGGGAFLAGRPVHIAQSLVSGN